MYESAYALIHYQTCYIPVNYIHSCKIEDMLQNVVHILHESENMLHCLISDANYPINFNTNIYDIPLQLQGQLLLFNIHYLKYFQHTFIKSKKLLEWEEKKRNQAHLTYFSQTRWKDLVFAWCYAPPLYFLNEGKSVRCGMCEWAQITPTITPTIQESHFPSSLPRIDSHSGVGNV